MTSHRFDRARLTLHEWSAKCGLELRVDDKGEFVMVIDPVIADPIALFTTERETLAFLKGYFLALPVTGASP